MRLALSGARGLRGGTRWVEDGAQQLGDHLLVGWVGGLGCAGGRQRRVSPLSIGNEPQTLPSAPPRVSIARICQNQTCVQLSSKMGASESASRVADVNRPKSQPTGKYLESTHLEHRSF